MSGAILWFTGLSGSGKSTLANAVGEWARAFRPVEVLDGDQVRNRLSKDLGYSRADRDANVHRVGVLARRLARQDVFVIAATISPYAEARADIRRLAERDGTPFALIFLDASLPILIARDPKGLYRRALAGDLPHFTGVSDPYERPTDPDITINTDEDSAHVSARRILDALVARRFLPAITSRTSGR